MREMRQTEYQAAVSMKVEEEEPWVSGSGPALRGLSKYHAKQCKKKQAMEDKKREHGHAQLKNRLQDSRKCMKEERRGTGNWLTKSIDHSENTPEKKAQRKEEVWTWSKKTGHENTRVQPRHSDKHCYEECSP